jgi:hypothetical protein
MSAQAALHTVSSQQGDGGSTVDRMRRNRLMAFATREIASRA